MNKSAKSDWLGTIPKASLSKVVVEKIQGAMIAGELGPGDFLPSENELAARLGVGKSSVREAVKMLEALGVVEIIKGNGSRIRTSIDSGVLDPVVFQLILRSSADLDTFVEFRMMLETSSTLMAMEKAEPGDLDRLRAIYEKQKADLDKGANSAEDDVAFHQAVYAATHNPFIIHLGNMLVRLFRPSLEVSNREYPERVLADHKKIIRALEKRDADGVRKAIGSSLRSWNKLALGEGLE